MNQQAAPSRSFIAAITAMIWCGRWAATTGAALFDFGWTRPALRVALQQGMACIWGALLCLAMGAILARRAWPRMDTASATLFLMSAGFAIVWSAGTRLALAPLAHALAPTNGVNLDPEPTLSIAFIFLAWSMAWFSVSFADRLRESASRVDRAEARVVELEALLGTAAEGTRVVTEIWAPSRVGAVRVATSEIASLSAEREYVRIRTAAGDEYLVRAALRALCERLDPTQFVQTHRSSVVNVAHIAAVERRAPRGLVVVMRDGRRLPVGRNHHDSVRGLIGAQH